MDVCQKVTEHGAHEYPAASDMMNQEAGEVPDSGQARLAGRQILPRLYVTTVVTICLLFAAQPIQPVFQGEFGINGLQASLFTTLMMLPLGFAPLLYGILLEVTPARKVLRNSLLLLGLLDLAFSCADGFGALLALRALQGVILPAVLTALMSYISYTSTRERVQQAIAVYIGMTVIGGILGRLLSALFTQWFGWRLFFFVLAIMLLWCWHWLSVIDRTTRLGISRFNVRQVSSLLRSGPLLWLYAAIFFVFFAGTALLNFVPFEIVRKYPDFGEGAIGLLYLGNSTGIIVALGNARLQRLFGGETATAIVGLLVFMGGSVTFLAGHYLVMFGGMFVFCLGMFTAHATLSGYVSKLVDDHKPVANGLYMSFYYFGGAVGSFVPGLIYEPLGWLPFIVVLLVAQGGALLCVLALKKKEGASRSEE